MKQYSLGLETAGKHTRCQEFLNEIASILLLARLGAPHLADGKRDRPTLRPRRCLHHLHATEVQLERPRMEDVAHDMPLLQEFGAGRQG